MHKLVLACQGNVPDKVVCKSQKLPRVRKEINIIGGWEEQAWSDFMSDDADPVHPIFY